MRSLSTLRMLVLLCALNLAFAVSVNAARVSKDLESRVSNAIGNYYSDPFYVSVNDYGKVMIKGEVPTLYDKMRIFEIASAVPGVFEIENLMTVANATVPDKTLESEILEALKENESILEPDRIAVRVNNGLVFFTGEVSFYREKLMATTIASWQKGVKGIENELTVLTPKAARSDANLDIILHEILENKFPLDKKIDLTVQDGIVKLRGQAYRLWDKNKMEEEFLKVLGVKGVVNELTVRRS